MKMKNLTTVCALAGLAVVGTAEAQSNDALIKALVKKGMLTEAEAASLRNDAANTDADAMAAWVESLSLKGDLRLRYDHTHDSPSNGASAEDRWRYRFRFGGTANMQNGVKAGFRLASGGSGSSDDIGSTNETFSDGFARDSISLDQAWAQMEFSGVTMIGGKNPNWDKTGWFLSKALFDGDITPEGFEAHYTIDGGSVEYGIHGGAYFIEGEDDGSSSVNNLFIGQLTAKSSLSDTTGLTAGLAAYTVDDGGLTQAGGGKRKGNSSGVGYSPVMLDLALSIKKGPGIKLYGTWVDNQEADTNENGYLGGIKFGSAKAAGQWEAKYEYRVLEKDAVWDDLVDSDFGAFGVSAADTYKSGTNVKGSVIQGKYNIYDNVQAALTFMITEADEGAGGENEDNTRIQADLIFKF